MARSGDEIVNPRTGQRTVFLETSEETGGALMRMESVHPPHAPPEPEHVHPFQESRCRLLEGSLFFSIAGVEREVRAGEEVVIPANVPHFFWNPGEVEARSVQEFRPAQTIEFFFERYFAMARAGHLNEGGVPRNPLRLAAMLRAYDRDIRTTNPPRVLQQLLATTLGPIGQRLGYSAAGAPREA